MTQSYLRKRKIAAAEEEKQNIHSSLVVIGYASNIFRDDHTALEIECERLLIPWKQSEDLLLDRYEVTFE
jgi:hypothetical protein